MKRTLRISACLSVLSLLTLALVSGCKKEDEPTGTSSFDQTPMLTNIGTNIILPSYQALQVSVFKLDSTIADFNSSPDATKLQNLQDRFVLTYQAWVRCAPFEFGPAESRDMRNNINIFPASTTEIDANISSGSYVLTSVDNMDAKGLPALDYLLYGIGADNAAILAMYVSDANAANRKQYLADISTDIKTNVDYVANAWSTTYLNTFIANTGNDVGSSLSMLVNEVSYELDFIKGPVLGIPMGKKSAGVTYPEKTEAYYSGISVNLLSVRLQALENVFLGKDFSGNNGQGLDDYLNSLNAQYQGGSLTTAIQNQFTLTITKANAINNPLSAQIGSTPNAATEEAYIEVQKLLVLLKTDMASALSVFITYADSDGD